MNQSKCGSDSDSNVRPFKEFQVSFDSGRGGVAGIFDFTGRE
jgi:hypothetical protein